MVMDMVLDFMARFEDKDFMKFLQRIYSICFSKAQQVLDFEHILDVLVEVVSDNKDTPQEMKVMNKDNLKDPSSNSCSNFFQLF
mmetsp:Transcript_26701/g.36779  ORF Transcript_26701/g.36779 Transcript_26701/m.36779 type:complete len:84 (+) Transcript_26701:20-271(+)